MFKKTINKFKQRKYSAKDIALDEVFLDSQNLPSFDQNQLEGRIEKPISKQVVTIIFFTFILIFLSFLLKIGSLQIVNGQKFAEISKENSLRHTLIFADRGIVYDRNHVPLIWNVRTENDEDFSLRKYIEKPGFANLLGYVKYPKKDSSGFYYTESFEGIGGLEQYFDEIISGKNGLKIIETNALMDVVGNNTIQDPVSGKSLALSIDADLQSKLYSTIADIAGQVGFKGGSGVIMDVHAGEILAVTSYPEFDSNVLTEGSDKEAINNYLNDTNNRFLNRATKGLYTPGSILKPFVALGALNEGVISPTKEILSVKNMEVPNPYDPSNPSIFTDWKAHGYVNVYSALAYSSNVYFYQVAGGYTPTGQKGIGITKLEQYFRSFGFGDDIDDEFLGGKQGTIPNPKWKMENFDGDDWRLGDTYFTAIGQYGVQVTPVQIARAVSAIANNGKLIEPTVKLDDSVTILRNIDNISQGNFDIVKKGMRDAVLYGTAKGLNLSNVEIAAKTGTAELGVSKENVNSSVVGFFPYQEPKYAFVVVMEQGSRSNFIGGVAVMRQVLDWINIYRPEYF
jgi:penicillin-binding protein 2